MEDVTIAGYEVQKGELLSVNYYVMHRNPRFFPNPERFGPERFAPDWEERIPRYAYLPFGSGLRICIGNAFALMEGRLILATIAKRYRLSLQPGQMIKPIHTHQGEAEHLDSNETPPALMRMLETDALSVLYRWQFYDERATVLLPTRPRDSEECDVPP